MIVSLSWFRAVFHPAHEPCPGVADGRGDGVVLAALAGKEFDRLGDRDRAVAGWAAIIRPVDALVYALPVGVAMLPRLRRMPVRQALGTIAAMTVPTLPFLAMQAVFDRGVTGHLLRTPYSAYRGRISREPVGFHRVAPGAHPASTLAEKQAFYEWAKGYLAAHRPGNFLGTWGRKYLADHDRHRDVEPMVFTIIADWVARLF